MANDNGSRERILSRIRQALAAPAPPLNTAAVATAEVYAPIENVYDRFLQECQGNLTEVIVTSNREGSAFALAKVIADLPEGEIFVEDVPSLREISHAFTAGRQTRWSSEGAPAEATVATVTLAEALVAQTGSILTSSACGGRGASIVPPTHIVSAHASQILPDIETALRFAQETGLTDKRSYVGLITGSSRTADIEKILVLGAHGPRRVVLVLER